MKADSIDAFRQGIDALEFQVLPRTQSGTPGIYAEVENETVTGSNQLK